MRTFADLFAEQFRLKAIHQDACREYEAAHALASLKLATMDQAKAAHKAAEIAVVEALPRGRIVLLDDGSAISATGTLGAIFGPVAQVWPTVKACDVLVPEPSDGGPP